MTHRRFRGVPALEMSAPGGNSLVFLADSLRLRFAGLMRVQAEALEPVLFPGCRSLHTFWMRSPIDVVWLDLRRDGDTGAARVLEVVAELPRRRTSTAPAGLERDAKNRVAALELPPGGAGRLGLTTGAPVTFLRR